MTTITRNYPQIEDDDLEQHIQDTPMFGAIRNGQICEITWNQLTPDEQRAAYTSTFEIYM